MEAVNRRLTVLSNFFFSGPQECQCSPLHAVNASSNLAGVSNLSALNIQADPEECLAESLSIFSDHAEAAPQAYKSWPKF